jgi:hypothetical protein
MSANSDGNQKKDRRRWRRPSREDRRDETPAAHESSQQPATGIQNLAIVPQLQGVQQMMQSMQQPMYQFVTGMHNLQGLQPMMQPMLPAMMPSLPPMQFGIGMQAPFIYQPGSMAPQYGMQPGYSMIPALAAQQPYSYGNNYAPRPLKEQGNGREDKRKREDARDVKQEGAGNTKQEEKQPANKAKERVTRHCNNCGRDGHWLKDCIGPVNIISGMIMGCPWCGVTQHIFEECGAFDPKDDDYKKDMAHYMLECRANKPPLVCSVHPKHHVQKAPGERFHGMMPWTTEFSLLHRITHMEEWKTYDYSNEDRRAWEDDTWDEPGEGLKPNKLHGELVGPRVDPARPRKVGRKKTKDIEMIDADDGEGPSKRQKTDNNPNVSISKLDQALPDRTPGGVHSRRSGGYRGGRQERHPRAGRNTGGASTATPTPVKRWNHWRDPLPPPKLEMNPLTERCDQCGSVQHDIENCFGLCSTCGNVDGNPHQMEDCPVSMLRCRCKRFPNHVAARCELPCSQACKTGDEILATHGMIQCQGKCCFCGRMSSHSGQNCPTTSWCLKCGEWHPTANHDGGRDLWKWTCLLNSCGAYFCQMHCHQCGFGDHDGPNCPHTFRHESNGIHFVRCSKCNKEQKIGFSEHCLRCRDKALLRPPQ